MRSYNLSLVSILLVIYYSDASSVPLDPSENVQYVFNVPSRLEAGSRKQLQTAISNLQEQVTLLSRRLRLLEAGGNITAVQDSMPSISGTNYVRWGRKSCPAGRNLIYTGLGAKSYHLESGGGIDLQCPTNDPEDPDGTTAGHQANSYMYGVEYLTFGSSKIVESSDINNDLPCSVCEVPTKTQTLMIPSKRNCPTGWTKEYEGYLMAERHNHNPSNFICVDRYYEYLNRGSGDQSSGYIYTVEIVCGIIPCPPYTEGIELACVMCSK